MAAPAPALGPHGDDVRWRAGIQRAGGGEHDLPVSKMLTTPRQAEVTRNHKVTYAADVQVEVPYRSGPRPLTHKNQWFQFDPPAVSDKVTVIFAPSRPDLGARPGNVHGTFSDLLSLSMILGSMGACLALTVLGVVGAHYIAPIRRFRCGIHPLSSPRSPAPRAWTPP
ncbi:hypothetical protein [Streptomyces broussonetiae]|uniref:hypothetical protein n=1 Tax=Streptomyces broussonetiae TaxID=2686304 RepID=UPI0035DAB051